LDLIQDYLLRMARVLEGSSGRWIVPTKWVEREISAESYRRFQSCTAGIEPQAIKAAYWASWRWGLELSAALAARHELDRREGLAARLTEVFKDV
jgi:lincosamide nucleotidyltransferase